MLSRRTVLSGALATWVSGVGGKVSARNAVVEGQPSITLISDGAFELSRSMLARDIPPDVIAHQTQAPPVLTIPLTLTCLRRDDRVILFDTGAGQHFLPGTGKLAANLEARGIAPDSVTDVVFTHLHPDHFWGALDDFDMPLFPNARWLVSEREHAFWSDPRVYDRLPADRHAFAAGAQRLIKTLGERLQTRPAGTEWLPRIMALETPGHTPGHVSFELAGLGDPVFVLGDAMTHTVVSFAYPQWQPVSDQDGELAARTRLRLLDRAVSERARVIGYHLDGATGRVERHGTAFRFVPDT